MRTRLLAAACLAIGLVSTAGAADITSARVEREDDRYHVEFVVSMRGEAGRLRRIITDYAHLHELSPTIVASRVLSGRSGGDARVEVIMRPCVLIVFCRTITKVSDSRVEPGRNRLEYVTVPELSDFHEGRETITMMPESTSDSPRVRFRYSAVLRPDFFVPPFVGPWLIRRAILDDLEATSRRVERLLRRERE